MCFRLICKPSIGVLTWILQNSKEMWGPLSVLSLAGSQAREATQRERDREREREGGGGRAKEGGNDGDDDDDDDGGNWKGGRGEKGGEESKMSCGYE